MLFGVSTKTHCENTPEDLINSGTIPDDGLIPLPVGYSLKGVQKEKVFAVSIDSNRFYPMLRKGMVVYLKPFHIANKDAEEYSMLCLYRDNEGWCTFEEFEYKADGIYLLKNLLTGNSIVAKSLLDIHGKLYQAISIVIKVAV